MKQSSALYSISDRDFLREAWKALSKRNARSRGLDNVTIRAFKNRLEENLSDISDELRSGKYQFTRLRAHAITKSSGKPRPLQIASVRDRVVMKALARRIQPNFDKFNLDCSFAFIKGRGVNHAIGRIQELIKGGYRYYFESDIIDFFGTVDKSVLWDMFAQVKLKSLMPLLKQCFNLELEDLSSHTTEFQKLFFGIESGIPQGGILSPMLANYYLYEFDRRLSRNGFMLVRYADDFVVMCKTKEQAIQAYWESRNILQSLGLSIHPLDGVKSKSKVGDFSKDGLTFLGIRFEGNTVYPTSQAVQRFKIKIQEVLKPDSGENLFRTLQRLSNLIEGWGKWYRTMKVQKIYDELDTFIKHSVSLHLERVGIKLIGKNKRKHMRLLGVPSLTAMVDHTKNSAASTQIT